MKYIRKTLVLLLVFYMLHSNAQVIRDSSSLGHKTWVGVNVADLLVKDPIMLPNISVNWNYLNQSHLRFQLGFEAINGTTEFDVRSTQAFNNFTIDTISKGLPYKNWNVGLSLGYYNKRPINRKVDMYFGADFVYRRGKSTSRIEYDITQDFGSSNKQFIDVKEKKTSITEGYGVNPLVGLQWKLGQGLCLGFETQAMFLVQRKSSEVFMFLSQSSSFNPNQFVQESHRKESNQESVSRLLPMAGLYLLVQL